MAHTPGPWHVGSLPPPVWRYICSEAGETIAAVAEWDESGNLEQEFTDQAKANACLIAAAPELLEALRNLLDDAENHADGDDRSITLDVTCSRARAAIAKAEGQA